MSKVYCAWAGESVDADEHQDCICKNCDYCGEDMRGRGVSVEAYNGLYLHKGCILPYLFDNGEAKTYKELKEENG